MREENVINVSSFASDLPRPKKWEAAKKHIATLSEEELIQQAGKVLQSIHADTMFYRYFGMADYKIGLRLNDLLEELHKHIAAKQVKKRFTPMLEKHQREINLFDSGDYDALLQEGFIDQELHAILQRSKGGHTETADSVGESETEAISE